LTEASASGDREELPTFSECVVGYRSWNLRDDGQLWPLREHRTPWQVEVNTARCDCGTSDRLHFEWSIIDGRRVLEPAPLHDAPAESCTCGLYSVRRPATEWEQEIAFLNADRVAGAVASWGRIQVHGTGIRAEHACILALAVPERAGLAAAQKIERAAARYGVDAVALTDIEIAAAEHGSALPDEIHAAADRDSTPTAEPATATVMDWAPAPNATEDEVDDTAGTRRRLPARPRHLFLIIVALLTAVIILLITLDHRSTPCKLQILNTGAGGTIERCASNTTPTSNR
jgi:hypothetical protein